MWSGRYLGCRCINYLIRAKLSHHKDRRGKGVDVRNGGSRRVLSPGMVVVVVAIVVAIAAAATVVVVVGGGGLLRKRGERREVATSQRALHTSASPNQRCKCGDRLYAKQSPS